MYWAHAVGPLRGAGPGHRDGPDGSLLRTLTLLVVAAAQNHSNWPFLNTRPSPVHLHAQGTKGCTAAETRTEIWPRPGYGAGLGPPTEIALSSACDRSPPPLFASCYLILLPSTCDRSSATAVTSLHRTFAPST